MYTSKHLAVLGIVPLFVFIIVNSLVLHFVFPSISCSISNGYNIKK